MANQIKKKYLDQEVISYFDDQIDAVELSVTAEETARIAADQALQGEIDAAEGRLDTAEGEIDTLQTEMDAVEGRLNTAEGEIDTLQSEMDAVEGRLDTVESTLLVKADLVGGLVPANQLPSYVDDVLEFADLAAFPATGEAGKIYVALDTNKCYRWSGSTYIQITSGAVDSVNGQNGVVVLTAANIDMVGEAVSVENKLISLQGEIDTEETARANADSLLQDNINAEESARIAADGVLQSNIDAEESARIAADSALDVRVTALEEALAPTWNKVKFDLTATNISDGYVDLAHEAISNSIHAFVDRLAIHQDEDFTVSVVGGVTRITFAGDLVSPGQSQLDANDNIYVRYQYLA
ncbi:MAG: hypothetical protein VKL41_14990 [Snowella sp.]|nr:hypothetical protein [Snowella sp.]